MTTKEAIFSMLRAVPRNDNGTVFIGPPEIRDLARRVWRTPATVNRILNVVGRVHGKRIVAVDGTKGFEIPTSVFAEAK